MGACADTAELSAQVSSWPCVMFLRVNFRRKTSFVWLLLFHSEYPEQNEWWNAAFHSNDFVHTVVLRVRVSFPRL